MSNVIAIRYCSFCGKSEHQVEVLFVSWNERNSPGLCDECTDLCSSKLAEQRKALSDSKDQGAER